MSDLPKSVFQKDGAIYLPLSWKEAYHLRHVLRQHLKRYPDACLARRTLKRMEGEDPDQGEATASNVIAFPRRPWPEKSRVLITLERGVIVAADFDWVEYHGRTGVRARCDDDSTESYIVDSPSMAEYYDVKLPEDATYEQKKQAVMAAAGWDYDEECEWLEVDENGDALPECETDQVINEWLSSLLIDVDIERHGQFAARIATEYTPGFEIWRALPAHQAERLGFCESDLGGPASSVPCVSIRASAEELQQVLELYGLPFSLEQ
jgi:hypothetical protein